LKLGSLADIEAVQPLGEVVQLIDVHRDLLQPFENEPRRASELVHLAVAVALIADLQTAEHLNHLIVLLLGNRERNGRRTVFRVL
jgi:hypothetical protein